MRFFFDFGAGCLWSTNEPTRERFGYAVRIEELPDSQNTVLLAKELADRFMDSLNWDYPPDPGPWRQSECDAFNRATAELLKNIRSEVGEEFEIIDEQKPLMEDPDLDAYLTDPKRYSRRRNRK
jgi:hypothetical protein